MDSVVPDIKTLHIFEQLRHKGAEYYMCARHLHLRGAAEVIEETKALVIEAKAKDYTYQNVVDHMQAEIRKAGLTPSDVPETDPFLEHVKRMFEAP